MKTCRYCGRQNEDSATRCAECGREDTLNPTTDAALTDPNAALVVVAEFNDLISAGLLRDELQAADIEACIPEDTDSGTFGHFVPMARITVRVAARDLEAAKQIVAAQISQTTSDENKGSE